MELPTNGSAGSGRCTRARTTTHVLSDRRPRHQIRHPLCSNILAVKHARILMDVLLADSETKPDRERSATAHMRARAARMRALPVLAATCSVSSSVLR
eukprot:6175417-Pleurochrysis_carterae.AAC.3